MEPVREVEAKEWNGERRTRKTRAPSSMSSTRRYEALAAAACWFVLAKRSCRQAVRGCNWRAIARVTVRQAFMMRDSATI
jgi:hypothetical protein